MFETNSAQLNFETTTSLTDLKPDVFLANKSYPDAKGLFFDATATLESVKQECVVVLDTNALLVPYGVSTNSLSEIEKTYISLAKTNRLVVAGQVAREFAKNRPLKIAEIYGAFSKKRNLSEPARGRYPLLEGTAEYKKMREIEGSIDKLIKEYRESIASVLNQIKNWNWNDPVSNLYCRIFPDLVVDPDLDKDKVLEQLNYSHANKLPPGYKDSSKDDRGVGDQLVWNCVVAVASERKCPIVFVSGDIKADWFYRSENQPLLPRFELVDEIRRVSQGKSLHIVPFSKFLELFGADVSAIGEVRKEEINLTSPVSFTQKRFQQEDAYSAEFAVETWIKANYPESDICRDERFGDFVWTNSDAGSSLIEVTWFGDGSTSGRKKHIINALLKTERILQSASIPYKHFLHFWVFDSIENCDGSLSYVKRHSIFLNRVQTPIVFAVLTPLGLFEVLDVFKVLPDAKNRFSSEVT